MPDEPIHVDSFLATACSRFLHAGETVNHMRLAYQQGDMEKYWKLVSHLAEHLSVAGHCVTEADRILLALNGVNGVQQGGLVH